MWRRRSNKAKILRETVLMNYTIDDSVAFAEWCWVTQHSDGAGWRTFSILYNHNFHGWLGEMAFALMRLDT